MIANVARILLLADTHLGFDLPLRPRIERRRRGHDFFANYEQALQPARRGEVDLVIHGGDLFHRSKVAPGLIEKAMAPLAIVANQGVPIFIVPGNHERSTIPLNLWSAGSNILIFHQPGTFTHQIGRFSLALSGFPFSRAIGRAFPELLEQTRYSEVAADLRLLCLHQTVEGARVGPSGYTFRAGRDVIGGRDIPPGFSAILSGHIHRAQMLTHDLNNKALEAPVIYAGSIERTSFAERGEEKGYWIITAYLDGRRKGELADASFVRLPARPMIKLEVDLDGGGNLNVGDLLRRKLSEVDPEAVVRLHLRGASTEETNRWLSAETLRSLAPPTMNISLANNRTQNSRSVR